MPLYILTGLPYTGKHAVFSQIFAKLRGSPHYVFMRVVSTRPKEEVNADTEVSVTEREFLQYKDANTFVYTWTEGKGHREAVAYFGIPASMVAALHADKKVFLLLPVVNKQLITDLHTSFGMSFNVRIILLTLSVQVLIDRLTQGILGGNARSGVCKQYGFNGAVVIKEPNESLDSSRPGSDTKRKRDTKDKDVEVLLPSKVEEKLNNYRKKISKALQDTENMSSNVSMVSNDQPLADTTKEILKLLDYDASKDTIEIQPNDIRDKLDETNDLQTCTPERYLQLTVAPFLQKALTQLEIIRPADPIEYLALHLLKDSQMKEAELHVANQINTTRNKITIQVVSEKLAEMMEASNNG